MATFERELDSAVEAARAGGEILREAFHSGRNHSDVEAEHSSRSILLGRHPEFGYRGKARPFEAARDPEGRLWLVDPMDGTQAFEEGYRGPSVSIALLRRGEPVLGVIFAFSWPDDEGDLFAWAEGMPSILRNGIPLRCDPQVVPATVALSERADGASRLHAELCSPYRYRTVPSLALRLALVAAGEALACNSSDRPSGRVYAAGHALLRAAGLELCDSELRPIRYSQNGESACGDQCTAGAAPVAREVAARRWGRVCRQPGDPADLYDLCPPNRNRLVADPGLLRRAQGCLLGQLAGDALGSLVEFSPPASIVRRYPQGLRLLEDGGTHGTIAGQPTDDSEMALMLARAVLRTGYYDAEAVAQAYCWWLESGPFDIGITVATALRAGVARARQEASGVAESCRRAASRISESNGALMRVAPIGILGGGASPSQASRWADEDAQLTHPNPVCRHANSVFAASLAFAIRQGAGARATFEFALAEARRIGAHAKVRDALARAAAGPPEDYTTNQGHVIIALQNAFYQALHASSVEEGIVDTVRRGGDTDTNAAIAGALLGAIHGRPAVPFRWLERLLTCRPIRGIAGVRHPRPKVL